MAREQRVIAMWDRMRRVSVFFLLVLCMGPAWAQADDPVAMITKASDRVLVISREARSYYDKNPERYYDQVEAVLDEVVDFDAFTRGVMASYASAARMQGLKTDAERAALQNDIQRFGKTLRHSLVVSYGKAAILSEGHSVDVQLVPGDSTDKAASVIQHIQGTTEPHVAQYSLRKNEQGVWKIRNIIVDGVNLGQIYRTQFSDAVEKNRGDVGRVIDTWMQIAPPVEKANDSGAGRKS